MKNDTVPIPSKATLNKYGLTLGEWQHMWVVQEGICPICWKPMTRAVVDHYHVKGWKQMPPEQRRLYIRSLLCWICNTRVLTRGITPEKLDRASDYLRKWEKVHEYLLTVKDTKSKTDSDPIESSVLQEPRSR